MKKLLLTAVAVAAATLSISAVAQQAVVVAKVTDTQVHSVFHQGKDFGKIAAAANAVAGVVAPSLGKQATAEQVAAVIHHANQGGDKAVAMYINSQKSAFGLNNAPDITEAQVFAIHKSCVGPENDRGCADAVNKVIFVKVAG